MQVSAEVDDALMPCSSKMIKKWISHSQNALLQCDVIHNPNYGRNRSRKIESGVNEFWGSFGQ
jgi:hypothetical protein